MSSSEIGFAVMMIMMRMIMMLLFMFDDNSSTHYHHLSPQTGDISWKLLEVCMQERDDARLRNDVLHVAAGALHHPRAMLSVPA